MNIKGKFFGKQDGTPMMAKFTCQKCGHEGAIFDSQFNPELLQNKDVLPKDTPKCEYCGIVFPELSGFFTRIPHESMLWMLDPKLTDLKRVYDEDLVWQKDEAAMEETRLYLKKNHFI